ncbi:iron-sulfur cluster assembly scaffold protein [Alcaligenaceae bacterium CGII-47]|nr:iron-sulfur cluster assembly scaffold protein [Alcaligenaceae bacterium CGII-47]
MLYSKKVLDHYENPRNVGSFDPLDASVGTALVGSPALGEVMKLQIRIDASGTIHEACFRTFGCGSAIAASSLATVWLQGKSLDDALAISNLDITQELELPPLKAHCAMLAEDAIRAAVRNYQHKHQR